MGKVTIPLRNDSENPEVIFARALRGGFMVPIRSERAWRLAMNRSKAARFWTAPAERSGDGALDRLPTALEMPNSA